MGLPGYTLSEYLAEHNSQQNQLDVESRLPRQIIASYYEAYAKKMVDPDALVRGIVVEVARYAERAGRWRVVYWTGNESRTIITSSVVLATGTYDVPKRLRIPGEDFPFVHHKYGNISSEPSQDTERALLVVGAGLSACDAILSWLQRYFT